MNTNIQNNNRITIILNIKNQFSLDFMLISNFNYNFVSSCFINKNLL